VPVSITRPGGSVEVGKKETISATLQIIFAVELF
jgi:hypothetical protein